MLYGDRNIDNDLLNKWILNWEEQRFIKYLDSFLDKKSNVVEEEIRKGYKEISIPLIKSIKEMVRNNDEIDLFNGILGMCNKLILNCYFKNDNHSISVANFNEILLKPADIHTRKSIIKGYDSEYPEFGGISLKSKDTIIGHIGQMSDLLWTVIIDNFMSYENKNLLGTKAHNNLQYLSLQLWDKEIDQDNFEQLVQKIIYYCSTQLGLNFKIANINNQVTQKGENNNYEMNIDLKRLERTPLQYFNFSNYSNLPRIKYLSYYQVIEYFFEKSKNLLLREELIQANISDENSVDFAKVKKAVNRYSNLLKSEKETLEFVLEKAINYDQFLKWINEKEKRKNYYTTENEFYPELKPISTNNYNEMITSLRIRIYSIRCSIVHSKEKIDELLLIPKINEKLLKNELELMKYVSKTVLEFWSDITMSTSDNMGLASCLLS